MRKVYVKKTCGQTSNKYNLVLVNKFFRYCEDHENAIILQIEQDLKAFKKALPHLRKRMREKFEAGAREHGENFLEIERNKIDNCKIEELTDLFFYAAQPRYNAWLKRR